MTNIFQGERVRLRAVESSDWEVHYDWNFDTDDARRSYAIPFPSSREQVQTWAESECQNSGQNDVFRFQIENLDGMLVGTLNTINCDSRCGTFGYGLAIRPEHRRKGYASEAIRLLLRYYFQERRYQKVNAEVYSFNEPSIQLHENLGFTLEGRLRRMIYTEGQFFDALIYGMTVEEFTTQHLPL